MVSCLAVDRVISLQNSMPYVSSSEDDVSLFCSGGKATYFSPSSAVVTSKFCSSIASLEDQE